MTSLQQSRLPNILSGILDIICCRGDYAKEETSTNPVSYREMFRYANYWDVFCVLTGSLFGALAGAIQPWVLVLGGWIVSIYLDPGDKRLNDKFRNDVNNKLWFLGLGGILSFICTYLQSYLLSIGCHNISRTLRRKYLGAVLRQEAAWFDSTESGVITTQLNDNIERLEDALGDKLGLLIRGFSMFISSVVVCLAINWQLTLITLSMGPISAITLGIMGKFVSGPAKEMAAANSEASCVVEESVMNIKTVAACNGQEHMIKKYAEYLQQGLKPALKYHFWVGFFEGLSFLEIYVVLGIAFWYGIIGFHNGIVRHRGDVLLIANTISLTAYYLGLLGPHMMSLLKARVAAAVIYDTIDRDPLIDPRNSSGIDIKKPKGTISFENVKFAYSTRDSPILKDLSWRAEAGESVALVGQSGSGKSTSIGLITRLYEVDEGNVKIDGIPIRKINIRSLRQMIGVVEQEPCLFNGSVLENIQLGRENVTENDAKQAAKVANAHEFISKLSDGYNTVLGSGGVSLSGGQKQRIAIARAIAGNPKILLLDEATSALDTESEKIVQEALNEASIGRTTVIIAHRLSTLKNVNKIFVLQDGRVAEVGSHPELIQSNGIYAQLCKAQEVNNRDSCFTVDPNEKRFRISSRRKPKKLSETTDDEEEDSKAKLSNGFWLLYTNLHGNYGKFFVLIIFACVRGMEMPLLATSSFLSFKGLEIERDSNDDYKKWALITLFVSIACGFIVWIAQAAQYVMSGWTADNVVSSLRVRILRSLLYRPISEFDDPGTSQAACVSTIAQHAPNCQSGLDYNLALNIGNFFSVVVGLISSFVFSWEMGCLGTGLCILLYIITIGNIQFSSMSRSRKHKQDKSGECSIEIIEQARTVQLLNSEQHFLEKYCKYQHLAKKFDNWVAFVEAFNFGVSQSFVFFCDLSCFALGTYLIYHGRYGVERIFLAFIGSQIAGWSVMYSAPCFPEMVRATHSARQLFRLIDDHKIVRERMENGLKLELTGSVELENVKFGYKRNIPVAQGLNIKAEPGQSIALVGPSGCGKSTVINLLEAFYKADEGKVVIDNHSVQDLNIHHLRKNVALVGQEPVLFKGSILENITLGVDDIGMEEVIEACRMANATSFIESFPMGYDTNVGEKGRSLSGGQKQRIAIARALVRNPRILLLDEATSALDTESEKIVQAALQDAGKGRTSITVAHRLSSIQHCSKIYVMDGGRVVESGTHEELLQLGGRYLRLVQAQKLQ